jgi:DNA-binding transcriptional LysR family regulator
MQSVRRMLDWNDIRHFLAVARTGSTAAAARALGVNQTTVARRIAEMERALGARLFDRRPEGVRIRPEAAELLAKAQRIETEVAAFENLGSGLGRALSRIRVTTNEPLANAIMAPAIAAYRSQYSEVQIDLLITPRQLDLIRGEADVALRAAPLPEDSDLIARRVGEASWGIYCSHDYARLHGAPRSLEDLAGRQVLMVADPSGMKIGDLAKGARLEHRETLNDLCIAARAGVGVVSIPCVLGESQADLLLCFVQPEPSTPIWLIYHERLR